MALVVPEALEDLPAYSLVEEEGVGAAAAYTTKRICTPATMGALAVKVIAVALAVLMAVGLGQVPTGDTGELEGLEVTQAVQALPELQVLAPVPTP